MGDKLGGYESQHGGGGEAVGLAAICERAAKFPAAEITMDRLDLSRQLSGWIRGRLSTRPIAGGKYPHLCAMGPELVAAAGDGLRVVVCDRPLVESIASLQRRSRKSKGWLAVTDDQAEAVQRWLWEERELFLDTLPKESMFRVNWDYLQSDTSAVVAGLVDFLGISPTADQVAEAVGHIRKDIAA
jgi:hypothetical protein